MIRVCVFKIFARGTYHEVKRMDNKVRFFPNRTEFKTPVGALKANEPMRLNLMFSRPSNPVEVHLVLTKDNEQSVYYPMNYVTTNHNGLMEYTIEIKVFSSGLYFYHFQINTEIESFRVASDSDLNARLNMGAEWQLTVYEETYQPPQWLKGGIMYQIMVDRFNIGGSRLKTKSDVVYRDDWGGVPQYQPDENGKIANNDLFGGNIKGITKKLAYLKSLGITCIYLNPIFEAHSNHKYDTANYRKVDSDFGTADDLKELIVKAKKKGMYLMLDGVFSHTGDDSIYFNKHGKYDSVGAYQSVHSPYFKWYKFNDFPDDYDCWWNIDILPNVNEENVNYREFITGEDGVIRYWTEMGLGGWRLDVADELTDELLDKAVHAAKKANPQAVVLGEVWEDASNKVAYSVRRRYFNGGQLDSVTNYPFKEDILNFVRCGDANRLNNTINVLLNNYPKFVLDNVMNILDTHDTARLLTVLGDSGICETRDDRAKAKLKNFEQAFKMLKLATILQYTLMGVPCVYYADEIGMEGFEDPFNRRCYTWDSKKSEVLRWYKRLGAIRTGEKNILSEGTYRRITCDNGVLAFTRSNEVENLTVIVNRGVNPYVLDLNGESYINLITMKPFNGTVAPDEGAIIKRAQDVIVIKKG